MKKKVQIGDKFNKLTVKEFIGLNDRKERLWKCECECGGIKEVKSRNLTTEYVKSCGCIVGGHKTIPKYVIGDKKGNLEVLEIKRSDRYRCQVFVYKCKCGDTGEALRFLGDNCPNCAAKLRKQRDYDKYNELPIYYWNRIISQAKLRSIEFSVSIEYLWEIFIKQNKKCVYSDIELYFSAPSKIQIASLDRIDSTKGYIVGNVQWVHKDVNKMKQEFSEEYFLNICDKIYNNRIKNGINNNQSREINTSMSDISL